MSPLTFGMAVFFSGGSMTMTALLLVLPEAFWPSPAYTWGVALGERVFYALCLARILHRAGGWWWPLGLVAVTPGLQVLAFHCGATSSVGRRST